MDASGKEVIAPTYKAVGYFSNGLAWAKNTDGTVGYIDKTGKNVIAAKFLAAKEFDKVVGVARVKAGDEWMYLRKNGETFTVNGATGLGDFSDGLAYAKMGEKVGFVNDKGEWTIEAKFDKVRDFQAGYAAVRVGEKEEGYGDEDKDSKKHWRDPEQEADKEDYDAEEDEAGEDAAEGEEDEGDY